MDSFELYRELVNSFLAENSSFHVIGEAADGPEAIAKAQQLQPDLVLMDVHLGTMHGLEVARQLRQLLPSCKIVFLTLENDFDVASEAISVGASGYLLEHQVGANLVTSLMDLLKDY